MNWNRILFIALVLVAIVGAALFFKAVLGYLIAALLFSYILEPIVNWLENHYIPRVWGIILLYLSLAGLIAYISSRFIPILVREAESLIQILRHKDNISADVLLKIPIIDSLYQYALDMDKQLPSLKLADQFLKHLDKATIFMARLPQFLVENYAAIIGAVSFVGMTPLMGFFILKDRFRFRKGLLSLSSNRYFELMINLMDSIDKTVGRYLRAMFFEVIAVSIIATFALTVAGISNPILIGVIAGITNIIPYFGPFFGGALAVATVFFEGGSLISMVYAALVMWAVQLVDNNLVYPVVIGKTMNMHPLLVLLTVLAGGWYGGILWMLISVPLVYLSYTLIKVLHTNLKEYRII